MSEFKANGNKAFIAGDYAGSIEWYTKAIGVFEGDSILEAAVVYTNRATAYHKLNRFEESMDDAEKAIRLEQLWPKAYYRKALAAVSMGDLITSAANACTAHALDPVKFPISVLSCCFSAAEPMSEYEIHRVRASDGPLALMKACFSKRHNRVIVVEGGTYNGPLILTRPHTSIVGLGPVNIKMTPIPVVDQVIPRDYAEVPNAILVTGRIANMDETVYTPKGFLYNVHCSGNAKNAFYFPQQAEYVVEACSIVSNKEPALCAHGTSRVLLNNVTIRQCAGSGVLVTGSADISMRRCTILDGKLQALEVRNEARLTCLNSTITGNAYACLCWEGAAYLLFSGNHVSDCAEEGVLLNNNVEAIIERNRFTNAGQFAVSLGYLANATIDNNYISSAQTHGIYINGGVNAIITRNEITDCMCTGVTMDVNYERSVCLSGNNIHHNRGQGFVDTFNAPSSQGMVQNMAHLITPNTPGFRFPPGVTTLCSKKALVHRDNIIIDNEINVHTYKHTETLRECNAIGCGVALEKTKMCSRCRHALYCSAKCQMDSWSAHKSVCKSIVSNYSVLVSPSQFLEDTLIIADPGGPTSSSTKRASRAGRLFIVKVQANAGNKHFRAGFSPGGGTFPRAAQRAAGELGGAAGNATDSEKAKAYVAKDPRYRVPEVGDDWTVTTYNESREFVAAANHKGLHNYVVSRGMAGHLQGHYKKIFLVAAFEEAENAAEEQPLRVFFYTPAPPKDW
jgi:hypothetical protein